MAVIALDLGGTKLAAALLSDNGTIHFRETTHLEKLKGAEVGKQILHQAHAIIQSAKEKNIKVSALGICVPGIAHPKTGTVWAPNIPGWDDYPLLKELKNGLANRDIKIKMDSDRACYILGEVWKGNAAGHSDVIFFSVGTGIGAGILVNNEVLRGAHDIAGAIGWMALNKPFRNEYISCGCFEHNASGEGLVKVANELLHNQKYAGSILDKKDVGQLTAKDIFAAYESNDNLAVAVIDQAIEYWGMAVANLVSIFNPGKIIFGGGVFGPALKFLDAIFNEAKKWGQPISMQHVKLEAAALGNDAGLYGAGYLALKD
ncbi:MAG TPA: ROK family protein [Chitinophagaceae bacterium]|nr:ROK family protein [Chitinophagaceae bacterium]